MIRPCLRCKNQRGENELRNIRGNDEVEGQIIVNYPEVLEISPDQVCVFQIYLTIIQYCSFPAN